MLTLRGCGVALVAASLWLQSCVAQVDPVMYTDPKTGITLGTWGYYPNATDPEDPGYGAFTFGMALPPNALTVDATEYIGMLRCSSQDTTTNRGWCGISHGVSGQMTNALLIMAWMNGDKVMTSLRYTNAYKLPPVYTGNATLTQISSWSNATDYGVMYRCQGCLAYSPGGGAPAIITPTSQKYLVMGRAQAYKAPLNPKCPAQMTFGFHDNGYAQFPITLDNVTQANYDKWTPLATTTVSSDCSNLATVPATTTATPTPVATSPPIETCLSVPVSTPPKTYDYIIVGAGAGGIPLADKITAAGHSVLLLEKGPPSTGRFNGTWKPEWLQGTNLTRFDVPGLCNEIWVDSNGIACEDTDQMAGCVLGGGTAINAGLWWKPNPKDWDYNFPTGWKSGDLANATNRVFSRIPGTTTPSMDGKLYQQEGFNVLAGGFNQSGWGYVTPNDHPDQKNRVYGHTTYMFSHGERGGPMATYLDTAIARKNLLTLYMNTAVTRLVRTGGHVTGVEVECKGEGGLNGMFNVTASRGRVILAGGVFGTSKVLMRSGIGPKDQLERVQGSTDGPTMIGNQSWIDLPVGYNLVDHVNTDLIITHPDVVFYDFYLAYNNPNDADKAAYLANRTRILAQSAPNIGPMFWEEIKGSDGVTRQLQWTARVEGDAAKTTSPNAMTLSQYLGRGSISRGRLEITQDLDTTVTVPPYLHSDFDVEAVIQGIKSVQTVLNKIPGIQWVQPDNTTTVEAFVKGLDTSPSTRRSNHWMGSTKIGTDDGRLGGTAVVDLNTKVYGTDNLFVVDAGIFPGQPTGNPSAMIVIAAENAATRILALAFPRAGQLGAQCGGSKWTGAFQCAAPYECRTLDPTYSICALATGSTKFNPDGTPKNESSSVDRTPDAAAQAAAPTS